MTLDAEFQAPIADSMAHGLCRTAENRMRYKGIHAWRSQCRGVCRRAWWCTPAVHRQQHEHAVVALGDTNTRSRMQCERQGK